MFLSIHIPLWFVVLTVGAVAVLGYLRGRSDERREWMERLGRR
jgi:hypothetical protein